MCFRNAFLWELAHRSRACFAVREVLCQNGGGLRQVVGTPEHVADTIGMLHSEGAADGFNLMIDVVPSGIEDFGEHVVPLLP